MILRLICTNNNTRLILSPLHSSSSPILIQYTSGIFGFKGATRSSIYAADTLFKKFYSRLHSLKLEPRSLSFILLVKGLGPTRNYMLRKLAQLKITQIKDITSYPHNGCRKKKSLRK